MAEKIEAEFIAKPRKASKRARSAVQAEYDREVELNYSNNTVLSYVALPAEVEELVKHVESAARYLKVSARAGDPRPGPRKGTVLVQWKFVPVAKRAPREPAVE